jgi:hypothetical protein
LDAIGAVFDVAEDLRPPGAGFAAAGATSGSPAGFGVIGHFRAGNLKPGTLNAGTWKVGAWKTGDW